MQLEPVDTGLHLHVERARRAERAAVGLHVPSLANERAHRARELVDRHRKVSRRGDDSPPAPESKLLQALQRELLGGLVPHDQTAPFALVAG